MCNESLFDFHELVQITEGDLRFEHPELSEVAARLRFLSAEGWTEAIDFSKGEDIRFVIELSCLGEIGRSFIEVGRFEESGRSFGGGRGEDRRIEVEEAM